MIFNGSDIEQEILNTELLGDIQKEAACRYLGEICEKVPNVALRYENDESEYYVFIYEASRPDELVFTVELHGVDYTMGASSVFSTDEIITIRDILNEWFNALLEWY